MSAAPSLLVTTSFRDRSRSQLWTGLAPLAIGHPFKWVVERIEGGVRIRNLTAGPDAAQEITYEKLVKGAEIAIRPLSLRIRSLQTATPVYAQNSASKGGTLEVFLCQGTWIVRSETVQGPYIAAIEGKPVFSLSQTDGVTLTARAESLTIERAGKAPRELRTGEALTLEASELAATTIRQGASQAVWRLQLTQSSTVDFDSGAGTAPDAETLWFHKAMRAAGIGFAAFVALTLIWPKPKPETQELVPPQFAKLLLKTPSKSSASSASSESAVAKAAANPSVPKKVQDAAVVQAFRAKALTSAVSGLLKGGMSSLLAQSEFTHGSQANAEARRIFDTKSESLRATGANVGAAADKNVKIASLGGEAGGKSVGYAKGEKAGLKGQGKAFVSMDIGSAAVEEGLSKDEVGEVIHRHMSEIRYCYESAMLRSPEIEGKLIVDFTIGGIGAVTTSEVKQSTLPDARLDDCIIRRLVTWKFPNPKGGINVAVSYPFIFKTLGR